MPPSTRNIATVPAMDSNVISRGAPARSIRPTARANPPGRLSELNREAF
jgi:hypothetical protein